MRNSGAVLVCFAKRVYQVALAAELPFIHGVMRRQSARGAFAMAGMNVQIAVAVLQKSETEIITSKPDKLIVRRSGFQNRGMKQEKSRLSTDVDKLVLNPNTGC